MARQRQTSDAQLRIGESRDSQVQLRTMVRADARPGMTVDFVAAQPYTPSPWSTSPPA